MQKKLSTPTKPAGHSDGSQPVETQSLGSENGHPPKEVASARHVFECVVVHVTTRAAAVSHGPAMDLAGRGGAMGMLMRCPRGCQEDRAGEGSRSGGVPGGGVRVEM